jgi:hypothetical protein
MVRVDLRSHPRDVVRAGARGRSVEAWPHLGPTRDLLAEQPPGKIAMELDVLEHRLGLGG